MFNLNNEDQSICETPFNKAINFFNTLPTLIKMRYINIYQEIFNNLGIIYYNKGEIKKGLQHFGKAEQIYKVFNDLNGYNFTNDFPKFMKTCCSLNEEDYNGEMEFFSFYIDGGINKKSFEHNYTLTIFYYAQAFTKLGFRKKAIKYCSLILKRQIEFNEFELKDALVNCVNLSDFYMENQHFAQAEYILISAMSLLPDDITKRKKLRAAIQNQLGKYFLERLKFAAIRLKENNFISDNENIFNIVNKKIFTFNTLNIVWPQIKDVINIEQAKSLFRLANTQFKKALNLYNIENYPFEYIQICQNISLLYKFLISFEFDNNRIFAMEERRINILKPILDKIDHKEFAIQWQEVSLELAEIYCEIFESNYELIRVKKKKINMKEIEEINRNGEKSIFYYQEIIDYIVNEYNKEKEKKLEDFVTIITIKSNIGRLYSKLIFLKDIKKRIDSLKKSLEIFKELHKMLEDSKNVFGDREDLQENILICEEMIGMIPIKIDKISKGEESI
jgi:tetratricopeptide (TPR) repeat protein